MSYALRFRRKHGTNPSVKNLLIDKAVTAVSNLNLRRKTFDREQLLSHRGILETSIFTVMKDEINQLINHRLDRRNANIKVK